MPASKWYTATAVAAVLALAPWGIYLAGLGRLTDLLSDRSFSEALKQTIIMLEWYTISAQFTNLMLIFFACIFKSLRRTHSLFNMFLAVNTVLLINRATDRIWQINMIDQEKKTLKDLLGADLPGNPLQYLRAEACGQVASAFMNFLLAILITITGTVADSNTDVQTSFPYATGTASYI